MADELDHPHDKLFRAVFSDVAEAAALLRTALPAELREGMDWETLKLLEGTFLDDALRESESDLLYEVAHGDDGERVWLYVLLEHQSTPDPWMRFRLLRYCCRIWEGGIRDGAGERELRPIVPLVFYQGSRRWTHSTEFADLFPETAARLLAALRPGGGVNYFRLFVMYVMATQDAGGTEAFDEALRRHGRGQGGENMPFMSYAQQLLEEGRAEGREEGEHRGEMRGKVNVVEGFLRTGVTWDVIEAATGLDESAFQALKEQLSASDG